MQQLDYHSSIRKVFSLLKLYQCLKHNSKICQYLCYGINDLDKVRWLGHCPMQTIRDTMRHAKGIEELSKGSFDPNQQCPS